MDKYIENQNIVDQAMDLASKKAGKDHSEKLGFDVLKRNDNMKQCDSILSKVREAWTPDHRSFKEIELLEQYHRKREELIKFLVWFRTEIGILDMPIENNYFIDKYLKTKI